MSFEYTVPHANKIEATTEAVITLTEDMSFVDVVNSFVEKGFGADEICERLGAKNLNDAQGKWSQIQKSWKEGEVNGNTYTYSRENGTQSVDASQIATAMAVLTPDVQSTQEMVHALWVANSDLKEIELHGADIYVGEINVDIDNYKTPNNTWEEALSTALAENPGVQEHIAKFPGCDLEIRGATPGDTKTYPLNLDIKGGQTLTIPEITKADGTTVTADEFAQTVQKSTFAGDLHIDRDIQHDVPAPTPVFATAAPVAPAAPLPPVVEAREYNEAVGIRTYPRPPADANWTRSVDVIGGALADQMREKTDFAARGRHKGDFGDVDTRSNKRRSDQREEQTFRINGFSEIEGAGGQFRNEAGEDKHPHFNRKLHMDPLLEGSSPLVVTVTAAREGLRGAKHVDHFGYRTVNPINWEPTQVGRVNADLFQGLNDYAVFREMRIKPALANLDAAIASGDTAAIEQATKAVFVENAIAARIDAMHAVIEVNGQPRVPVEEVYRLTESAMQKAADAGVDVSALTVTVGEQEARLTSAIRDVDFVDRINLFTLPEQLGLEGDFTVGMPRITEEEFRDNRVHTYFPLTEKQLELHSWSHQDKYEKQPDKEIPEQLAAMFSESAENRKHVQTSLLDRTAPRNGFQAAGDKGLITAPETRQGYESASASAMRSIVNNDAAMAVLLDGYATPTNDSHIRAAQADGQIDANIPTSLVGRGGLFMEHGEMLLDMMNHPDRHGFDNTADALAYMRENHPYLDNIASIDPKFMAFARENHPAVLDRLQITENGIDVWHDGFAEGFHILQEGWKRANGNTTDMITFRDNDYMAVARAQREYAQQNPEFVKVIQNELNNELNRWEAQPQDQNYALAMTYRLTHMDDDYLGTLFNTLSEADAAAVVQNLEASYAMGVKDLSTLGQDPRELAHAAEVMVVHNADYLATLSDDLTPGVYIETVQASPETVAGVTSQPTAFSADAPDDLVARIMASGNIVGGQISFLADNGSKSAYPNRSEGTAQTNLNHVINNSGRPASDFTLEFADGRTANLADVIAEQARLAEAQTQAAQVALDAQNVTADVTQTSVTAGVSGNSAVALNTMSAAELAALRTVTSNQAPPNEIADAMTALLVNADRGNAENYMKNLALNSPANFTAMFAAALSANPDLMSETLKGWDKGDSGKALNTLEGALSRAAKGKTGKLDKFLAKAADGNVQYNAALATLAAAALDDPEATAAIATAMQSTANGIAAGDESGLTQEQANGFWNAVTTPAATDAHLQGGAITGAQVRGSFPQLPIDIALLIAVPHLIGDNPMQQLTNPPVKPPAISPGG